MAVRPHDSTARNALVASAGSALSTRLAAPACTTIMLTLCVTTSCISLAMRARCCSSARLVASSCSARAWRSRAPESPAALPAQGPLAWLTPREREVAALLLRGMSNRQIAEDLVITERTAETHVCRILSKLGLDSRAQIAAWVIDNGLLESRGTMAASAKAS